MKPFPQFLLDKISFYKIQLMPTKLVGIIATQEGWSF